MNEIINIKEVAQVTRRSALGWISAPLALGGCAAFNYQETDAPKALAVLSRLEPAPKIALVLGAGGPRGYAHIGIMRVFEEEGIYPDLIVGSSVGSLLGSFWASGLSAKQIDEMSQEGGPLTLFDPSLFADRGWIKGDKLQRYVENNINPKRLDELPCRMVVVATRRDDKQPRFFMEGNAGVAVRASSAMPGIISPVGIDNVEYEDGDESLPVPVSAAIQAGARFVIAVDVSPKAGATPDNAPDSFKRRDLARRKRIEPEVARADFLMHPDVGYWAGPFPSYFKEARSIGEAYARSVMPKLKAAFNARFGASTGG
jgi:NTE family protein